MTVFDIASSYYEAGWRWVAELRCPQCGKHPSDYREIKSIPSSDIYATIVFPCGCVTRKLSLTIVVPSTDLPRFRWKNANGEVIDPYLSPPEEIAL